MLELDTPHGLARVHRHAAEDRWGTLVLGHGAGGSLGAPDLRAATAAALTAHVSVDLIEQPYRVAGRRSAPPAHHLDAAWIATLTQLDLGGLPHVAGGRSSGARVACRTAAATGAAAVLCLAFPLLTPKGVSRQAELDAIDVPLLIVQGENDRFGIPPGATTVTGDHGLKRDLDKIQPIVTEWLRGLRTALETGSGKAVP